MKARINFLLVLSMLCTIPSCTKDEEYNPAIFSNAEKLISVTHSIYGKDSILYDNDEIKYITTYKKSNSVLIQSARYKLERSGEQVRVTVQKERPETDILSFNDSRISEIYCPEENFMAAFHYKGELVDYLLYRRGDYLDSLALFYDGNNLNISRLEWYNLRSDYPVLYFTADYTYDDKRNPYNKSLYWLVMNWKDPDDIVHYFNSNNILSIGFHELHYTYNEKDYPVYMDIPYYGRTSYVYQSW